MLLCPISSLFPNYFMPAVHLMAFADVQSRAPPIISSPFFVSFACRRSAAECGTVRALTLAIQHGLLRAIWLMAHNTQSVNSRSTVSISVRIVGLLLETPRNHSINSSTTTWTLMPSSCPHPNLRIQSSTCQSSAQSVLHVFEDTKQEIAALALMNRLQTSYRPPTTI